MKSSFLRLILSLFTVILLDSSSSFGMGNDFLLGDESSGLVLFLGKEGSGRTQPAPYVECRVFEDRVEVREGTRFTGVVGTQEVPRPSISNSVQTRKVEKAVQHPDNLRETIQSARGAKFDHPGGTMDGMSVEYAAIASSETDHAEVLVLKREGINALHPDVTGNTDEGQITATASALWLIEYIDKICSL